MSTTLLGPKHLSALLACEPRAENHVEVDELAQDLGIMWEHTSFSYNQTMTIPCYDFLPNGWILTQVSWDPSICILAAPGNFSLGALINTGATGQYGFHPVGSCTISSVENKQSHTLIIYPLDVHAPGSFNDTCSC